MTELLVDFRIFFLRQCYCNTCFEHLFIYADVQPSNCYPSCSYNEHLLKSYHLRNILNHYVSSGGFFLHINSSLHIAPVYFIVCKHFNSTFFLDISTTGKASTSFLHTLCTVILLEAFSQLHFYTHLSFTQHKENTEMKY